MPCLSCISDYMESRCGGSLDVSNFDATRLLLTSRFSYRSNERCKLTVQVANGKRIMAKFSSLDIESSAFCRDDRLTLYDGPSTTSPALSGINGICGFSTPSTVYVTSGQYLTLYFQSDFLLQYKGFTVILTEFSYTCNNVTSFHCRNRRCIDSSLTCDGWNNCGDSTDEIEGCGLSTGGVAGIVIGAFFVVVVLITVSIFVRRRRARYTVLLSRPDQCSTVTKTTYSTPVQGNYPSYQQQQYPPPPAGAYSQPGPLPAGAYPQ
ncbi:membrane frizzled-related protein-like isoform X2 [Liolophura sinensis]|uniref:membrane frizzled-related protein-like isoform X2 n=1 Tax=Liolophura sinensis TaxID=3198878 RepID=UPI0031596407